MDLAFFAGSYRFKKESFSIGIEEGKKDKKLSSHNGHNLPICVFCLSFCDIIINESSLQMGNINHHHVF